MMNWNALYDRLRAEAPALELRRDEPMSRHTSFQVGGPVPLLALPKSEEEVQQVLSVAAVEFGVKPFFMGKGTNLLVSDGGADLLVVKAFNGLSRLELLPEGEWPGHRTIQAGSGVSLARLASFALECGLAGLEFAHGIPGTLGGAVVMNAGAYDGEMAQVVAETRFLTSSGEVHTVANKDHQFTYRSSRFSQTQDVILSCELELRPGSTELLRTQMQELSLRRRSSQPLEWPSGGSVFKRPQGHYAAALIDQCGLKGLSVGGAQVSEKHCGFVINRDRATAKDVRELCGEVKRRVLEQLLYHLGRWIYLVDAADDLEEDFSSGSYNPLIGRFRLDSGTLTEEAKETLALSLDHSIRLMAAAFELWDFGRWSGIIRSTVYEGLFLVGKSVLERTFHAGRRPWSAPGRNKEKL